MKHEAQAQFGDAMACAHPSDPTLIDKWEVLQHLSEAAQSFNLNHRTLGVLRALMTFHRDRLIGPEHLSAVVFASNRTLSHRLNGMPESTLRRHLSQLVAQGIVSRHSSANGKRFSRGAGEAYGFDLSPLARNAAFIAAEAQAARKQKAHLASFRDKVAQLRQEIIQKDGESDLTDEAHRILRRKPNEAVLEEIYMRLRRIRKAPDPIKLSTADMQTERHIQSELFNYSEAPVEVTANNSEVALSDLTMFCREYKAYYPEPLHHWNDAWRKADALSRMMGIEPPVFHEAMALLGKKDGIALIFGLLDRLTSVQNPGGYLRRLVQNARVGGFSVINYLKGPHTAEIVS